MKHDLERDEWLRERVNEDLKAMVEKQERQLEMSEQLQVIDIPMERLEDIYRRSGQKNVQPNHAGFTGVCS